MVLAVFLTLVFVFMAVYSFVFIRRDLIRYLSLVIYAAAIFFVWNPNATTVIANFWGVNRGIDFVLVLLSIALMNGILICAKHISSQHQQITKIVRHMAIRDARVLEDNDHLH